MSAVKHSSRQHAMLSASGASRWLNCPPSARLEEKYLASTPATPSVYAAEGTLAHEFGDINLKLKLGNISQEVFSAEIAKLRKHKLYTDEMEGEVEKYVNIVWESYMVAKQKTPDAVLLIEERLDFSHLVPDGFGTGDANIIADGILEVQDLKYGKGVKVNAKENPQLMLYGLGALRTYDMVYDIQTVRLTIIQPRLDHVSTWDIPVTELEKWGQKTVAPTAKKAYRGEGEQKAGEWCRWCKVAGMCATLAKKNVELAKYDFEEPRLLDDDTLLAIYSQIPMLTAWAKAVDDHLLKEALQGHQFKGYKVVEGSSRRKFSDEEQVLSLLKKKKFRVSDITETKLKAFTKLEKLVGKSKFYDLLGDYITKPQGKPAFVPDTDPRPAMGIEQAKKDFQ